MFVGANNWRPKIAWQAKVQEKQMKKGLKGKTKRPFFFINIIIIISILFTNP